jgi:hypothetical protein
MPAGVVQVVSPSGARRQPPFGLLSRVTAGLRRIHREEIVAQINNLTKLRIF